MKYEYSVCSDKKGATMSVKENDPSNDRPCTTTVHNSFIPYQSSDLSRGVVVGYLRVWRIMWEGTNVKHNLEG